MFLGRLWSLFLSPLPGGEEVPRISESRMKSHPQLPVAGLGVQVFAHPSLAPTLTSPAGTGQCRPGRYSASMSVCLSFPICKIRALPVIPGARWRHCYVPEVSSRLPQRLSHSPGVAPGCGQGPWGEGSCTVTGNLLRAPKSVDSIPHLTVSTCSGTSRGPAEPISTQLRSAARSALLPFPESN